MNLDHDKIIIVDLEREVVELSTLDKKHINFKFGDRLSVFLSEDEFKLLVKMFNRFKEETLPEPFVSQSEKVNELINKIKETERQRKEKIDFKQLENKASEVWTDTCAMLEEAIEKELNKYHPQGALNEIVEYRNINWGDCNVFYHEPTKSNFALLTNREQFDVTNLIKLNDYNMNDRTIAYEVIKLFDRKIFNDVCSLMNLGSYENVKKCYKVVVETPVRFLPKGDRYIVEIKMGTSMTYDKSKTEEQNEI